MCCKVVCSGHMLGIAACTSTTSLLCSIRSSGNKYRKDPSSGNSGLKLGKKAPTSGNSGELLDKKNSSPGYSEVLLNTKDPHYAPLDIGQVTPSGPYAALHMASPDTEWKETATTSTREYAVPPDAVDKPEELSSEFVDGAAPKPVVTAVTFGSPGDSTRDATAAGQSSSKASRTGQKKPLLPKKAARGKNPIPLAVVNPAYDKQDPVAQSSGPTTSSRNTSGKVDMAMESKSSTVEAKQEKTVGKKKQPFTLPAFVRRQSASLNKASGSESSSKPSVAELAKRLEKGNL